MMAAPCLLKMIPSGKNYVVQSIESFTCRESPYRNRKEFYVYRFHGEDMDVRILSQCLIGR